MPEKDPTTWGLATWLIALGMSAAGGVLNWYAKMKSGRTRAFNVVELVGEVFTSAFVGLGAFMALDGIGQPLGVCAASAGLSGHMAARLLFLIEQNIEERLRQRDCGCPK